MVTGAIEVETTGYEKPAGFWRVFPTTYLAYVVMYLLRKIASVSKPFLKEDVDFVDDSVLGSIDSAFFISYTVFQFFAGTIADTYGAKVVISVAFLACSLGAFMFGYAVSAKMMILAWFIEGLGHAPGFSCLLSTTVPYLPPASASSWTATWTTSQQVGSILSSIVGTALCAHYGWKAPYIIFGAGTLGMSILTFTVLPAKKPVESAVNKATVAIHEVDSIVGTTIDIESIVPSIAPLGMVPSIAVEEQSLDELPIVENDTKKSPVQIFTGALQIEGMIPACVCVFFVKTIKYCLIMWLPSLFKETVVGCDAATAGYTSAIYDMAGIFGALIAGAVADSAMMKGRKLYTGTWSLFLMIFACIFTAFLAKQESSLVVLVLCFIVIGILLCAMDMIFGSTAPVELVRRHKLTGDNTEYQATVMSIMNGIGSGGGVFQSQAVPLIMGHYGQWRYVVMFLGACAAAAFGLSFLFVNDPSASQKVKEEE